jgi:hypothetical protein
MKTLLLTGAITLLSTTAFSASNPQIRACHSVGGQFFVSQVLDDQIGLCKIGQSVVGSIDILNRDAQIEVPLSLHYYASGVKVCPPQNLTTLNDANQNEFTVCMYSDDSVIDIETLNSGFESHRNLQLDAILGL